MAKVEPIERKAQSNTMKVFQGCTANLEMVLRQLEIFAPVFEPAVEAYRKHCVRCGEVFRLRSSASRATDVYDTFRGSVQEVRSVGIESLEDFQQVVDTTLVFDSARRTVEAIHASVAGDLEQKQGYMQMFKFLLTTVLMLIVVVGQRGFSSQRTNMYQAIRGQLFGETVSLTSTGIEIMDRVTEPTAMLQFIETNVLDTIFSAPVCGDAVCDQPEEAPYYRARSDGARLYTGCEADCGRATTKKIRISFTDPWKLWYAIRHMEAARQYGWAGRSAQRWNAEDRHPTAGFNLCALNRSEYGAFEDVCILDGDIQVDGKWYRTDELRTDSTNFGGSLELDLFDADWELRIVYVNFEWPSLDTSSEAPPRAFPAVRGEICEEVATTSTGESSWGNCKRWAPCPDSATCRCFYYKSEYVCFDEQNWVGDNWDVSMYDFGFSVSNEWLGKWWGVAAGVLRNCAVNATRSVTTLRDVGEAVNGTLSDDIWNLFSGACADPYYLVVYDLFSDGGWLSAELSIVDTSTGDVVLEDTQIPPDEDLYFFDLTLCPQSTYSLAVTPDCDSKGSGGVAWELWSGSTWTIVTSGSDCVASCDPLKTNPCPSDCDAYGDYCNQIASRRQLESQQESGDGYRRNLAGDHSLPGDDGYLADDSSGAIDDNYDDSASGADDDPVATNDAASDDDSSQDDGAVTADDVAGHDNSGTDDGSIATDDVATDDIAGADDQPIAGVPSSTPTKGISSDAPTHFAQPFAEPTALTLPISAMSAAPSMFPTSLENVFGADLRDVSSQNQYFFITLNECEPASVADSECDSNNNNAACGWDGGDCCLDTCVNKGEECPLSESDCTSPVKLGSSDEDDNPCSFNFESQRRLDNGPDHGGDDYADDFGNGHYDDSPHPPTSSAADCLPDWPFGVAFRQVPRDEADWHLKMPFTAYEAFRDVMTVRNDGQTVSHEDMPSIFCGDCGDLMHLKEPYQSFKFKVSADPTNTTSSRYSVFPNIENLARSRYFVRPNLVQKFRRLKKGYMLTSVAGAHWAPYHDNAIQKQRIDGEIYDPDLTCMKDQKPEGPWAHGLGLLKRGRRRFKANRSDRKPFGTDATFMDSSSIYRATNKISDYYEADEVNAFGLPYGFFYRQGASSKQVKGYPIVFDVSWNVTRYKQIIELMHSGAYLDLKTRRLDFKMALLNVETGHIGLVRDMTHRVDGGGMINTWSISIVDALLYKDAFDWCRLFFEVAYCLALVYSVATEARELLFTGSSRAGALTMYLGDWKNYIDLLSFAAQFALVITWIRHAVLCSQLTVRTHAQVHANFFAVARMPKAGPDLEATFEMYSNIAAVTDSSATYQTVVAATIFFSILQFLKTLHFHNKLGLTTSTIFKAGEDLLFFAFLFIFVLIMYAVLGLLLFGEANQAFQNFGFALMSLVDILFGDFDSTSASKNSGDGFVIIFFYSFVVISSLILLNSLLAIIVDAYGAVKDNAKGTSREVLLKIVGEFVGWTSPPRDSYIATDLLDQILLALMSGEGGLSPNLQSKLKVPDSWSTPESDKVIMAPVYDGRVPSLVALSQPMLQALLKFVGVVDCSESAEEQLSLVCFNIVEQYGVEIGMESEHEHEQLALTLARELSVFRDVFSCTPEMLDAIALTCASVPALVQGSFLPPLRTRKRLSVADLSAEDAAGTAPRASVE